MYGETLRTNVFLKSSDAVGKTGVAFLAVQNHDSSVIKSVDENSS